MNYKASIYTLALLGALALAALSGGLLPSLDNTVYAADPTFDDTGTRSVPENTPRGVNIGEPVSATDLDETGDDALEFGNTLTYKLGGDDAASFDIDPSTGQLITKAPLDEGTKDSYSVTVTVDDGETRDSPITQDVTISVTEVTELPVAPVPPIVVSWDDSSTADADESTTSLRVIWHAPENMGRPDIITYAVQYKESTQTSFTDDDHSGSGTTTTIADLKVNTSYDVRMQATNSDDTGPWSLVGTGSTNKEGNSPPKFHETDGSTVELDVPENTPAGEDVDSPVTATDGDTASLSYGIDGPDKDLFNFDTRSGQIRTKAPLNHEDARCGYVDGATPSTQCVYRVTVTVIDGLGGSDARAVEIEVDDRTEPASAPARPAVGPTEKSSASLVVSWDAPDNTGLPPITGYNVEYRKGSDLFSNDNCRGATAANNCNGITDTTTTITGLDPNTTYEVRVRTTNDERDSGWSTSGTGRTSRANHQPIFDARPHGGDESDRNSTFTVSRRIDENPRSALSVGRVVADDQDSDRLTYKLVPSEDSDDAREEARKFTITETTGEIRTKTGVTYNYEAIAESGTCDPLDEATVGSDRCYTVTVEVRDGLDDNRVEEEETNADDSITLKIGVRNRDEAPERPEVTVTAPAGNTTLEVFWDAKNTGPDITSYDVQYHKGSADFSSDNCRDTEFANNCNGITDTTTIITGLDEDTSYSVQVRAINDEGVSAWSSPSPSSVKTNKGDNLTPTFADTGAVTLEVHENTLPGRDVGNAVDASDLGSTVLTYRLEGLDKALFNIVSSSGQIRTRSALDTEAICNPADSEETGRHQENCTYKVRVRVDDGGGGSVSKEVTIDVVDRDEPPSAPSAPRVTATKDTGWSLDVTWDEPRNTGKPPINDYDIQYRKFKSTNPDDWQDWPHGTDAEGNTDRSAKIETIRSDPDDDATAVHLEPRTQYEVRVKTKNGEGDDADNWSSIGRGTTGASNGRPSFDRAGAITLRVDENTRPGQDVGSAVSASDANGNRLTYTLEGPGKDSFSIVSSSGQVRTRADLNHEERSSYSVTVRVDDGQRKDNSSAAKSVTIMVDDVREKPPAPAAPRVEGISGSTDSVRVMWDPPANTGPSIDEYEVRYSGGGLSEVPWVHRRLDTSTIITGLESGTRYEVQVRARSDEGTSEWSRPGSGMPNPDVANRNPRFSGGSRSLSVPENEPAGTEVGTPIAATDQDGDTLTYTLEGADANSFDILSTSDGGQIRTSAALNHEDKSSYSVTVRVTDGRGGSDAVNVTIRVTDVGGEAPDTPFAPRVTAISSTSLQVSWEEPENPGPPINDYDYQYRGPSGSWTEVTNTTITGTTTTIDGLTPSTSYDVEVRARNAEGTSEWSNPGIGATNAPGANNPPVFTDGTSATRSVSASAPTGTPIGLPVRATDADSGDTLTYSLEGRDASLFDINTSTGQLLTKSGVTLIVGETYTVTVAADDGRDISRITVSINATAAPPNNPPVFSEGASATRSVPAGAPAGTSIGLPVAATDADQGDTPNYSLEGQDAASFNINTSTGQLLTISGVTLTAGEIYTVTVAASDGKTRASITVTIEITTAQPNTPPAFSSTVATRSVDENTPAGTDIGLPVSATDANAGDTLTYRLSGADAASFNIVSGTGQLRTNAALDYETKFRYDRVTVTVSDGELTDSIIVIINIVDMHPSCASAIGNGASTGLANDCEALLDSRDTLEGTGATRPLNWATHTRIANWYGVVLSDTPRRVIQLRLHGQNANAERGTVEAKLKGSIPPELGRLSELEILYLHRNVLTGQIPGALNNLSKLQQLYLYDNELTAISGELGSGMAELRRLFAQRNRISGSIPANLGNMPRLDWLRLDRNRLTGAIPSQLGNLSTLRRLYLHEQEGWRTGGGFSGTIPSTFSRLSRLEYLVLNRNSLGGQIPSGLGSLSNLKWLGLYDNGFTGSIPAQLGSLSNLERLYLHGNGLTGSVPAQLGSLSSLTNLWLKNNSLSGPIPEQLSQLELNRLRLSGSGLTACVPEGLVPTRTLYKSDGTEIPPTDDIEEAGLTVCGSGN